MLAPVASETRSPFRAGSEMSTVLGGSRPGGDQQRAELIAIQHGRVRLIVQAGMADMSSWGVNEELFIDGVLVEPGDGAQTAGDGGPGPAASLQIAGDALDAGAAL